MRNETSKGTVKFDGPVITLIEFKRQVIMNKFGGSADMDLKVVNEATKQEYTGDSTTIPRNTSVIIGRTALPPGKVIMFVTNTRNTYLADSRQEHETCQ